jgi:hypothetical protein
MGHLDVEPSGRTSGPMGVPLKGVMRLRLPPHFFMYPGYEVISFVPSHAPTLIYASQQAQITEQTDHGLEPQKL